MFDTAHVQALHASALISKGVLRKRMMSPEKSEKGIAKVQTFHWIMQHRGRDVHTTTCLFATPTFSDLQTLWEPSDQHCFIIHTSVSSFILLALVTTTETRWGFISTLKLLCGVFSRQQNKSLHSVFLTVTLLAKCDHGFLIKSFAKLISEYFESRSVYIRVY